MQTRQNELTNWLQNIFDKKSYTLGPLAGDASFRCYYRLKCEDLSYVIMDAPPDKETIAPFINIANILACNDVHVPAIHAINHEHGFILLEDLGDELLLKVLTSDNKDKLYKSAMATILKIQSSPTDKLPEFDKNHMMSELKLFHEYFLKAYLDLALTKEDELLLQETFSWLTREILKQPKVFIHRDYHSRNLIIVNSNPKDIGVIDFQDAMRGPFTYDLVSLLKDCYKQWPREEVLKWLEHFHQNISPSFDWTLDEFTRAFDLCGLQRHLKVLGIFCRLKFRDKKSAYLRDLPLTFNYVTACVESYSELKPFYNFLQNKVYIPFNKKCSI